MELLEAIVTTRTTPGAPLTDENRRPIRATYL
jgi:hypothetical protein